jgi:hypothetical protein
LHCRVVFRAGKREWGYDGRLSAINLLSRYLARAPWRRRMLSPGDGAALCVRLFRCRRTGQITPQRSAPYIGAGPLTPENRKRTISAWIAGIASPTTCSLWSGSPVAFARGAGHIGWHGLRQSSGRRSAFATYWTDFPMTACGGPRRGRRRASRPAASICRTSSSRARRTCRPGW